MNVSIHRPHRIRNAGRISSRDYGKTTPAETMPPMPRSRTVFPLLAAMLFCALAAPQAFSQAFAPASFAAEVIPDRDIRTLNEIRPDAGIQRPSTAHSAARTTVRNGWYIGMELGAVIAPKINLVGSDNDVATTCDGFFVTPAGGEGCNPPPSEWSSEMGTGRGVLAGLAFGYRMRNLRIEGEYSHRTARRDETVDIDILDDVTQDKAEQELEIADTEVKNVWSHNLFANLYYDFNLERKWTPYLGIGAGTARMSMDYFSRFKRNDRPSAITTFPNNPDGTISDLNRLIAGTTTIADARLKDTMFGYQAIAGLDYRVSDAFAMGIKIRWTGYFGHFEDGTEWNQLRSHDSARAPGGVRVAYSMTTEDLGNWGVSLATKYQF